MKLSNTTLSILKNFSTINQSLQFKPGQVLRTISPVKSVLASATVPDSFEKEFSIYDLPKFLGVISLFDNPDFEFFDSHVRVSSPGRRVDYRYADPSTLVLPPSKDLNIGDADVRFTLTSAQYTEIMKALGVLSLPDLMIVGEDGKINLRAGDSKMKGSNNYDIAIGETDLTFTAVFKTENLKLAANRDYEVSISSKGISWFKSDDVEYYIAIESNSKFD